MPAWRRSREISLEEEEEHTPDLQQNGECTHECIYPSALVLHSELHATCLRGRRQTTSVHAQIHTCGQFSPPRVRVFGLEEEADAETGRVHKLHTESVWELNF